MFSEGRLRDAARLFEQQHFEVDEAEPGWVGDVVVMAALELGKDVAQPLGQFTLCVGSHGEVLAESLTKTLDGIGCAGAEDFRVRFDLQKLGERQVPFLKTQPAYRLSQVAVLHLVFRVVGEFHGGGPTFFDAKLREKCPAARLEHSPDFGDKSHRSQIEDHFFGQFFFERQAQPPDPI